MNSRKFARDLRQVAAVHLAQVGRVIDCVQQRKFAVHSRHLFLVLSADDEVGDLSQAVCPVAERLERGQSVTQQVIRKPLWPAPSPSGSHKSACLRSWSLPAVLPNLFSIRLAIQYVVHYLKGESDAFAVVVELVHVPAR